MCGSGAINMSWLLGEQSGCAQIRRLWLSGLAGSCRVCACMLQKWRPEAAKAPGIRAIHRRVAGPAVCASFCISLTIVTVSKRPALAVVLCRRTLQGRGRPRVWCVVHWDNVGLYRRVVVRILIAVCRQPSPSCLLYPTLLCHLSSAPVTRPVGQPVVAVLSVGCLCWATSCCCCQAGMGAEVVLCEARRLQPKLACMHCRQVRPCNVQHAGSTSSSGVWLLGFIMHREKYGSSQLLREVGVGRLLAAQS